MPAPPPCLSPFSPSAVGNYGDECENAKSCLVSLGQTVEKWSAPARREDNRSSYAGSKTIIQANS